MFAGIIADIEQIASAVTPLEKRQDQPGRLRRKYDECFVACLPQNALGVTEKPEIGDQLLDGRGVGLQKILVTVIGLGTAALLGSMILFFMSKHLIVLQQIQIVS